MEEKDKDNKNIARVLRNNMTQWESKLWYQFLKGHPVKFRRQQRIEGYIVDFYASEAKVVIELDGSQHYEEDENINKDKERDEVLQGKGLIVLRIQDYDVTTSFDGVCEYINEELKRRISNPQKITERFGE